jgi:hypothetical protein
MQDILPGESIRCWRYINKPDPKAWLLVFRSDGCPMHEYRQLPNVALQACVFE